MISLAEPFPRPLQEQPQLIERITGIEDSSRNWSLAMTLEHTNIVASLIIKVVTLLGSGTVPDFHIQTARVKPQGEKTWLENVKDFEGILNAELPQLSDPSLMRDSPQKLDHPWFGPLCAREWVWLLGVHQTVHRRQSEKILKKLTHIVRAVP